MSERTPFSDVADVDVREREPMALHTTFRVGGPARYFLVPRTPAALLACVRRAHSANVPMVPMGGGTNLLVADRGYDGAVIRIDRNLSEASVERDHVRVAAGVRLPALAAMATRAGLAGMEALAGVPGTVGGALGIDAGAFGHEFGALVRSVRGMTWQGEEREFGATDIVFGYRTAVYPEPIIFAEAELSLTPGDPIEIGRRTADIRARRAATQPTRDKSAGCAFKNPAGKSAGASIDAAGLKGFEVGGAQVSVVHANYLVNTGQASAADILALILEVKRLVRDRLDIDLETEVRMLGFD